jgi:hypothetical protein
MPCIAGHATGGGKEAMESGAGRDGGLRPRDRQQSRRIRFGERNPGVHFTAPLASPEGKWGAFWADREGGHQIWKTTLPELLDELEQMFPLDSPRAGGEPVS